MPFPISIEAALCSTFTIGAAVNWGFLFACSVVKPGLQGSTGKTARVFQYIFGFLFTTSFMRASYAFVETGSRLLTSLVVLTFAGFFAGCMMGIVWKIPRPEE